MLTNSFRTLAIWDKATSAFPICTVSCFVLTTFLEDYTLFTIFYFILVVIVSSWGVEIFIDFVHYIRHDFLDVDIVFGWGLEVLHPVLSRYLLRLAGADHSLALQVSLVAHKHLGNAWVWVLVNTIHPSLHAFEGLPICQVKCYYHPVGLPVELICYCSKSFLTCSIPYLYIEFLISLFIFALNKVDT